MATSIFDNKKTVPTDEDLEDVLKSSLTVWNDLLDYLENEYGALSKEWKFYSKNSGWSYRIASEKRNLLFLLPNIDFFIVTVNMGVKISKIVLDSDISNETKDIIKQTKIYREGISILIKVENKDDLEDIKAILKIRDF